VTQAAGPKPCSDGKYWRRHQSRNRRQSVQATMQRISDHLVAAAAMVLMLALAGCASSAEAEGSAPWGSEAIRYFDELSVAYTDNDFYGVLDFYAVVAEVEKWRGDLRGGAYVSDLLRWNSGDLGYEPEGGLYLGDEGALSLVLWPRSGDQGAVVSTMANGLIAKDVVFDLAASLDRGFRAAPEVISTYEGLYQSFGEAWSDEDTDRLTQIYAPGASVHDGLLRIDAVSRDAIVELNSQGRWQTTRNMTRSEGGGTAEGASVYLGPRDYLQDPQRAVGVYEVADSSGCTRRVAVQWTLDAGLVVEEHRYWEVEAFRRCADGGLPVGWWTNLALPEPSDQVATGVLRTPLGQDVEIYNGTTDLEELVTYGLERFALGSLDEPRFDSVTFEPSRSCDVRTGRLLDDGTSRDVFLCMYERDLCPSTGDCTKQALSARVTVLHELGHAWMIDRVSDATVAGLLELSGRKTWGDADVPWVERGVEYAAEVIAWGLLDEVIPMVRIGTPPCEELAAAFELLTGAPPRGAPSRCPGN
jgi:hypothetical protein